MKKLVIVLGLLLSTASVANAASCAAQLCAAGQNPPCPCVAGTWFPATLAGWSQTYNTWTPGPGWVKVCTEQYAWGYCFKRYITPGTTLTQWPMGDLDVTTADYSFHVRYVEFYLARESYIYDNGTCSGGNVTTVGTGGLWYFNTLTAWDPSCLVLRN